jgi:quercetin dioxygenase-like cupin family protein
MAYAPARSNLDRDGRHRLDSALGGPVEEIRKGDIVWIPARVKHWHGATPNTAMTHIASLEIARPEFLE